MMKTNTEKTVQKELSLLIENINTFNKVAKSGANLSGDIFLSMLNDIKIDFITDANVCFLDNEESKQLRTNIMKYVYDYVNTLK